jgi:glycosyltransferase involved in cell wall biosynthesis
MKIIIALPAYNEELVIEKNVGQVFQYCQKNLTQDEWKIIICNNASTDRTGEISEKLSRGSQEITHLPLSQKGKGLAWKTAFLSFERDIYIFMDSDLAVDLSATKLLIERIKEGYDIVLGSRFMEGSKRSRSWQREIISTAYRNLARALLGVKITDFQCGFKAINRKVRDNILPNCREIGFFTDTELIYLAIKKGYTFKDIPVDWSEFRDLGRKSTVKVIRTSWDYLVKLLKLRFFNK